MRLTGKYDVCLLLTFNLGTLTWQTPGLDLVLVVNKDGVICLRSMIPHGQDVPERQQRLFESSDLPITSLKLAGEGTGTTKTAKSLVGSYLSLRLQFQGYETSKSDDRQSLTLHSIDEKTHIEVSTTLTVYGDRPVLRAWTSVTNESATSQVVLTQLSSLTVGGLTASVKEFHQQYSLLTANNGWFRETMWREHTLPELGIDDDGICQLQEGHFGSQATFSQSSSSSFSTGSFLPMGVLKAATPGQPTWLWQIEHNGAWRWEIGDYKDDVYLALGGPTSVDHHWQQILAPGETFQSVPVSLACTVGDSDDAFGIITQHRRAIRRHHEDNEKLPIIFNDYMNCLMGDPDEDKIKALLPAVVESGAEYFVIDAGWYADDSNWWDDVGLWEPSKKRFPSGFRELLDTMRSHGLKPGLWVEPEVVGVRSVVADRLPAEAFFQEHGKRLVERGRYQLDFRHPEVRKWMHSVVKRLVEEYGAEYFKFDYNIEVMFGSDLGGTSTGAAHLAHQRSYLAWITELLDMYPGLVIENCSSGAQRMEYGMLAVHPIQSTSDQQDPALYAAIAAAVPTAATPEQSATWAYPQGAWDDELNALTVVNSLLGRVHLSGRLDQLEKRQYDLIVDGMNVYKNIRQDLKTALPYWPLGYPKWHDDWLCLGMKAVNGSSYLAVWRRGGPTEQTIPLHRLGESAGTKVQLLYPAQHETRYHWSEDSKSLQVGVPDKVCARLFQLSR